LVYTPPGLTFLKKSSALWRVTKFPVSAPRYLVASLQRPPGKAFGAEHDLAGNRVKRPEELDIAIRTPDFGQVVEDVHVLRT
jgi:hypothetical protein